MRAWYGDATILLSKLLNLLTGISCGQPPLISWAGKDLPSAPQRELVEQALDPASPSQDRNLARLRKRVIDRNSELITFYLIGRAFQEGMPSLRQVAKELKRRSERGDYPDISGFSPAQISTVITDLADNVFCYHFFNKECEIKLIEKTSPNGPAALSASGWRAWEDTKEYLRHFYELPFWGANSTSKGTNLPEHNG